MIFRDRRRQLVAKVVNRRLPVYPGTQDAPQGRLLSFREGGQQPIFDVGFKEAGRRRMAGENNPDAPWEKGLILQHHFLGYDPSTGRQRKPPVQGELGL